MHNTRSSHPNRCLIGLIGSYLFLYLLTGCASSASPTHQPTEQNPTETPLTPTEISTHPTSPLPEMTQKPPHVSPYIHVIVEQVEIRSLATNPVKIELVIHGRLPDQCKYEFYSVEYRLDQNVRIGFDARHPVDNSCEQTTQDIAYVLLLGKDLPESKQGFAPGEYTLTVNNYQTTFFVK